VLFACGGTTSTPAIAPAPTAESATPHKPRKVRAPRVAIDPITAFTQSREDAAWIEVGTAQLVLGGTSLQPIDETPLAVDLLEERGSEIRIGVRLDHVRFAVWTSRARMHAVLARNVFVSQYSSAEFIAQDAPTVELAEGTHVVRLAHKGEYTQIRYMGSLEVEGWVPDDAVDDVGDADHVTGSRMPQFRPLMFTGGSTVRTENKWSARPLAVARYSMFVDQEEQLDDGWYRVAYRDGDVTVRGFLSKREPPSRVHRRRDPDAPLGPLATNATVPAETCLYAFDEPIGFVVGDRPALVEPGQRVGWFTITFDTPWGPIPFDATGPADTALEKCPGMPAPPPPKTPSPIAPSVP